MLTVNIGDAHISVTAEPLSQEAFAPFGDVITNPRPDVHPSAFASQPKDSMPSNAVSANQGTAIQYLAVSHIRNLYSQAPSGQGQPKMTMFVCATRELDPSASGAASQGQFKVRLLERHPFTTQTFTPLSSSASTYLVIVAPSLQPSNADEDLPTPSGDDLPGRGLPDIHRLKAFVATSNQAVTYGAEAIPEDKSHKLADLSGVELRPGENPYTAFISACNNDHKEIQALYSAHRTKRNAQQKEKFVSGEFKELAIDQHLLRLENPDIYPGFVDERNCFVIWARPPEHVIRLAAKVQDLLKQKAPTIWLMPTQRMHMTALEVAFSKTPQEIGALVSTIRSSIPKIASYTHTHRSRLVKPIISYDLSAFALSFLPAAGEPIVSPPPVDPDVAEGVVEGDEYTYHHVRQDVFNLVKAGGVQVGSRYQVPSAHITLGRYLTQDDHDTPEKRKQWVDAIDEINDWLKNEIWDKKDAEYVGEWIVGQERGLDCRSGSLWYGHGRTLLLGEGF
ncbi:unnamed protein product [Clonostachys rhizophaga]|uniref:Ureidoglycolate hydrolase n=1 Tax=Clonostachys rhizophaga TaxID=160324 RepID=A0A9N9VFW1_9HYPO|nr:unnamed protein product [Clonostachys rhizophaga]